MNNKIIELNNVSKIYRRGSENICAVKEVDLVLNKGDFCSVVGASGSGKTTLMNLIGCIDNPSVGTVKIKNKDVSGLPQKDLTKIRRDTLGFVFQQFFLIPTLTASENVQIPGLFAKNSQRIKRAKELLDLVGLSERIHHRPGEMSGGEIYDVSRNFLTYPSNKLDNRIPEDIPIIMPVLQSINDSYRIIL